MLSPPVAVCVGAALTMGAAPLEAQEATPTHVVMRYFKCNPQGEAVALMQEGRPVVDEMIAEGKFISHGIMTHNWGDGWNVVGFFAVDGLDSFFGNFGELTPRIEAATEGDEEDRPQWDEICTEHKDNIYFLVAPPDGS